jgi:eukaryotic translation initiation factor 2C
VPATIEARIQDKSEDALIAAFKKVKIDTGDMPPRPDFGTKGVAVKVCSLSFWDRRNRKLLTARLSIQLRANFFAVKLKTPEKPLHLYDVAITPTADTATRRMKRRIWHLAEETAAWKQHGLKDTVVHDHAVKLVAIKKLWVQVVSCKPSTHPHPIFSPQPLVITVPFYDEEETGPPATGGKTYTLTISYSQDIDMSVLSKYLDHDPQYRTQDMLPMISALNLVLNAHAARSVGGGVEVGRNKFFFPSLTDLRRDLGGGLEAWKVGWLRP